MINQRGVYILHRDGFSQGLSPTKPVSYHVKGSFPETQLVKVRWNMSMTNRKSKGRTVELQKEGNLELEVSSWWLQRNWKISVKMGIFPNFRGENKTYLKPPTNFECVDES